MLLGRDSAERRMKTQSRESPEAARVDGNANEYFCADEIL